MTTAGTHISKPVSRAPHGNGRTRTPVFSPRTALFPVLFLLFHAALCGAASPPREKEPAAPGLVAELAAPERDVLQAVQEVVRDEIIHGTYQFEKEQTLTGATEATAASYFGKWEGQGKVFYKVRKEVLAPRHFRESGDLGSITVRFVVQSTGPQRTRLRIDAVFIETARRIVHLSDGTVESSEYKAVQEHLQALQLQTQEIEEARIRREREEAAKQLLQRKREEESARLAAAQTSVRDLERRAQELRRLVEMRVKSAGALLKAAPFNNATTLQSLTGYSAVVILVITPYWYGIETEKGQHGWIRRDQVEPLP